MAWRFLRFLWGLLKNHPTASTVISGLGGISLLIAGIGLMVSTSTPYATQSTMQSAIAGGIFTLLGGLTTLGLVAYAAVDTHSFQTWVRPDGTYGHAVIRWAGPVFLILATVELLVVLWITSVVLEGMARK